MRRLDLERIKATADAARDWAALLYTPVISLYAVWLTALMVWAYPWAKKTEPQRLDFLGGALIGALCLIGLGTLFYQRRPPPHIRAKTPAGELEINGGAPDMERPAPEGRGKGDAGLVSAPVVQAGVPDKPADPPNCSRPAATEETSRGRPPRPGARADV